MDRFIEWKEIVQCVLILYLKSNMDRFIVDIVEDDTEE